MTLLTAVAKFSQKSELPNIAAPALKIVISILPTVVPRLVKRSLSIASFNASANPSMTFVTIASIRVICFPSNVTVSSIRAVNPFAISNKFNILSIKSSPRVAQSIDMIKPYTVSAIPTPIAPKPLRTVLLIVIKYFCICRSNVTRDWITVSNALPTVRPRFSKPLLLINVLRNDLNPLVIAEIFVVILSFTLSHFTRLIMRSN